MTSFNHTQSIGEAGRTEQQNYEMIAHLYAHCYNCIRLTLAISRAMNCNFSAYLHCTGYGCKIWHKRCHHAGVSCLVWSLLPVCLSEALARPDNVESTSNHVLLFKDGLSLFSQPVTSLGTCFVSESRSVSDLQPCMYTRRMLTHTHTNTCVHTHLREDEAISGSVSVLKSDAEWVTVNTHV